MDDDALNIFKVKKDMHTHLKNVKHHCKKIYLKNSVDFVFPSFFSRKLFLFEFCNDSEHPPRNEKILPVAEKIVVK
jgi:hypothetical protein